MVFNIGIKENFKYYVEYRSFQVLFFKDVSFLVVVVEDLGNFFLKEIGDFFIFDMKVIIEELVVFRLCYIEFLGKEQCEIFIFECFFLS